MLNLLWPNPVYNIMETTKKSQKKSSAKAAESMADKIVESYKTHLLVEGSRPASVFKFCIDIGIREDEFYDLFGSFDGIERSIWTGFIDTTVSRLEQDETVASFSAQEKVLAFYFTLLEVLKTNRSFAIFQLNEVRIPEIVPIFLKDFKVRYEAFLTQVLGEGLRQGELATRPYLDKRYPQLFWVHLALLLNYWKHDDSAGFEKTDAYVEKSVKLAFELMGKGILDSAIDFAKFMYQSRK